MEKVHTLAYPNSYSFFVWDWGHIDTALVRLTGSSPEPIGCTEFAYACDAYRLHAVSFGSGGSCRVR